MYQPNFVKIDLTLKGIKTSIPFSIFKQRKAVKIDLTLKGIRPYPLFAILIRGLDRLVEIDLILKGIKTTTFVKRFMMKVSS